MSIDLDDLVLQLKGLVYARALLEARGASDQELAEHTGAIERVRSELARRVQRSVERTAGLAA